jgi:hypothetical protein
MTVSYLSFRTPYSSNRECVIVIQPNNSAYRAVCVDAATRLTIGSPSIPRGPNGGRPSISAADVIGMIGGYRLAAAAVDIETDQLAGRTRRISNRLRSRRSVRRGRSHHRAGRLDAGSRP